MKKITAIILGSVALFAFSVAPAVSATKTNTKTVAKTAAASPKISKIFSDAMKSGKYYMKYTVISDMGGQKMKTKGVTGVDGKTMASEMFMEQMNMKTKSIIKDNKMYMIDDAAKTYRVMPLQQEQQASGSGDYSAIKFTGSGTGTIEGKKLPYEEYSGNNVVMRYYIDGSKLYAIETKTSGASTVMIIDEFSTKAPAELFNIPQGYKAL